MPIRVRTPDGGTAVFPDGMSDDQITTVLQREFPPKPAANGGYFGGMAGRAADAFKTAGHNLMEDARTAYAPLPAGQGKPGGFSSLLPSKPTSAEATQLEATDRLGGDLAGVVMSPLTAAFRAGGANQQDAEFLANVAPAFLGAPRALAGAREGAAEAGAVRSATRPGAVPRSVAQVFSPDSIGAKAAKFDQAGVTPTLAAVGPRGSAQLGKLAAEDPLMGGAPQARLQKSISETGQAATNLAGQFGSPASRASAGETIQSAAQRFSNARMPAGVTTPAQQTSFAAKANTLYDRAFSGLDSAMAGKTEVGSSQIATPATTAALKDLVNPAQAESVSEVIRDPTIAKLATAVDSGQGSLSFNDLRQLRTWVRTAKGNPELRQSIGDANLGRLEGALTDDIYSNAGSLGSPALEHQLRRADQFYAAGQSRISNALSGVFKAKSGEGAYDSVVGAAMDGGRADVGRLLSVKRSLHPDEWGDVAATALQRMGRPTPGVAAVGEGDGAFSVSSFVTNYNRLSPQGREILFGARGGGGAGAQRLRQQLDNLAEVADMQKSVEKAANNSRSAISVRGAAEIAGLANPHTMGPTVLALGGIRSLGEIMTNPVFVRWLAGAAKAAPEAMPGQIGKLQRIAQAYPKVALALPGLVNALSRDRPASTDQQPLAPQADAVVAAPAP